MTLLILSAFLAGFVDAVVGGGGLIQLPALFVFLPAAAAVEVPAVMGTNKFSSICGTSIAALQYALKVRFQWRVLGPAALCAFVGSFIGARAVSLLNPAFIRPVILLLLVIVAIFTYARKNFGQARRSKLSGPVQFWAAAGVGLLIGFYDGFFGPGTGSFLILAFVGVFGFDFLLASASAKVVNLATNLAAVGWFASIGKILYFYAIPMALANIAGAAIGARLAILKGNEFVRKFFLGVVLLLIARFAYEIAASP
jgi:uncharacterized membrane protein YfcA